MNSVTIKEKTLTPINSHEKDDSIHPHVNSLLTNINYRNIPGSHELINTTSKIFTILDTMKKSRSEHKEALSIQLSLHMYELMHLDDSELKRNFTTEISKYLCSHINNEIPVKPEVIEIVRQDPETQKAFQDFWNQWQ